MPESFGRTASLLLARHHFLSRTTPYQPGGYHSPGTCRIFDPAQSLVIPSALPVRSAHDVHQLGDLSPLIRLVAAADRMFHAMGHVIPQDLFLDAAKRRPDRRDLGDDVDAVAVFLYHFRETTNLPLDSAEAFSDGCLAVLAHEVYIPLPGMGYKAGAWQ